MSYQSFILFDLIFHKKLIIILRFYSLLDVYLWIITLYKILQNTANL